MQKIGFTITLLLAIYMLNAQTWQWLSPTPQGHTLYDIEFANQVTAYAAGSSGTYAENH